MLDRPTGKGVWSDTIRGASEEYGYMSSIIEERGTNGGLQMQGGKVL